MFDSFHFWGVYFFALMTLLGHCFFFFYFSDLVCVWGIMSLLIGQFGKYDDVIMFSFLKKNLSCCGLTKMRIFASLNKGLCYIQNYMRFKFNSGSRLI